MPAVVIISSQTLFVEGVAGGLRQHLPQHSIQMVDARQPDVLEQVLDKQPAVIIFDATDTLAQQACPMEALLRQAPSLTVVRLDPGRDVIQLVISEQRTVRDVSDLTKAIGMGEHLGDDEPPASEDMDAGSPKSGWMSSSRSEEEKPC